MPNNARSWERAEHFKGKAAGLEAAKQAIASLALSRNFGESFEDFLARDLSARTTYEAARAYLDLNEKLR